MRPSTLMLECFGFTDAFNIMIRYVGFKMAPERDFFETGWKSFTLEIPKGERTPASQAAEEISSKLCKYPSLSRQKSM